MADRKLRAVTADDVPAPPTKPKTVSEAARTGTVRELLEATRDRIAVAVENPNTPARDLAALTKRLLETVREIEAWDAREDADDADSADAVEDGYFDASAV
ncbi:hypothetical protein [Curtobacterium sp. VKM Ac-2884]|uniref:hypothetical protein n=1 Tax=Curtobacterium sp. VKM Ac-2884 TaxID=2783818 RepID=UPI00188A9890|nr:hypothetical protein [Curtobacterium sp. VKM Ac-2884]MBF4602823.1 hypothetical protein [Curtobacterium sp. VKM Ac-2884]